MKTKEYGCLLFAIAIVVGIGFQFALTGIATWLWGLIVVPTFGLPSLGFWQMYGLSWLLHFLTTSFSTTGRAIAKAVE